MTTKPAPTVQDEPKGIEDVLGRWIVVTPVQVVPRYSPQTGIRTDWARVPDRDTDPKKPNRFADGRLCLVADHDVYLGRRPQDDKRVGCQGNAKDREFFVCAVCYPPPVQSSNA
jgi:hypothetical protein